MLIVIWKVSWFGVQGLFSLEFSVLTKLAKDNQESAKVVGTLSNLGEYLQDGALQ
jgi:hypothetical protein